MSYRVEYLWRPADAEAPSEAPWMVKFMAHDESYVVEELVEQAHDECEEDEDPFEDDPKCKAIAEFLQTAFDGSEPNLTGPAQILLKISPPITRGETCLCHFADGTVLGGLAMLEEPVESGDDEKGYASALMEAGQDFAGMGFEVEGFQ